MLKMLQEKRAQGGFESAFLLTQKTWETAFLKKPDSSFARMGPFLAKPKNGRLAKNGE